MSIDDTDTENKTGDAENTGKTEAESSASAAHSDRDSSAGAGMHGIGDDPPQRARPQSKPAARAAADDGDPEAEDEEIETWTNQPSGSAPVEDLEQEEDLEDEGDEEEEHEEAPSAPRKPIRNARDVLLEELPFRAQRAKLRMRPHLTGQFLIEVISTGEKFLFDWRSDDPKVIPATGPVTLGTAEMQSDSSSVETIISISEPNLMAVRSGDLNPQVAMLADKIRVQGRMAPAVYLFNLVAPRPRD